MLVDLEDFPESAAPSPPATPQSQLAPRQNVLEELRLYLDELNFHGVYKNLVSICHYYIDAAAVGAGSRFVDELPVLISGDTGPWGLVFPLTTCRAAPRPALSDRELRLAEGLVEAGLLRAENGAFVNAGFQLISCRGIYLLIDARINFRAEGEIHRIYIGPDSYLLLYYLDDSQLGAGARVLDLCTGSGIVGLYASRFGARVVSTDVAEFPLEVASLNRSLNGRDGQIEIREQDLRATLTADEPKYDLICCNPPFVATPPGLDCAIYAQGLNEDGMGYLRLLFEQGFDRLHDDGRLAIVADMGGDSMGPHYFSELADTARRVGFHVDAFVDNVVSAVAQAQGLSYFLKLHHPGLPIEEIRKAISDHYSNTLRVKAFYLTTMVAHRAARGGLRVFNRFRRDGFYGRFTV